MFFWFPDWGWMAALLSAIFWIVVIVAAILLLKREVPNLGRPIGPSHALRILEERYARGDISRDEFLERREVLLRTSRPASPPPPVGPEPPSSEPTVELPDTPGRRRGRSK
jgi:putative membrane protein